MKPGRGLAPSKTILAGIIVVLVAAGALAWVASRPSQNLGVTTTGRPVYPQLVVGVVTGKPVLDPAAAGDYVSWEILSKVMEGLVRIDPKTGAIRPGLAEKWYSPDNGLTWIFQLRGGVTYSDGTPLRAEDVVRSIHRVMFIRGPYSWLVTEFIYNVQALNETTVMIKLKKPIQDFPMMVSLPVYYVVHPSYPLQNPVPGALYGGVGPYTVKSLEINQVVLEANPKYYGEKPGAGKLIFKFYSSSSDLRVALEKGEVDVAWWGLTPEDAGKLRGEGFKILSSDKTTVKVLVFKGSGASPTRLLEVRKAIAHLVGIQDIAGLFPANYTEPALSVIPSAYLGYTDALQNYTRVNVAEAQSLLKRAGYGGVNLLKVTMIISTTIYGSSDAVIADAIKRNLDETRMGFMEVRDLPADAFMGAIAMGDYDMALVTLYPIYPDPAFYIMLGMYSKADKYIGVGYANPSVDSLVEQALSTVDYSMRATIYANLQNTYLAGDLPLIPIIEFSTLAAVKPGIEGVSILPNMFLSTP